MEALRYIFSVIACMSFLWATPNSGRATEQIGIPSFHRVLVVNGTARPVVAEVQSGLITAILETGRRVLARRRQIPGTNSSMHEPRDFGGRGLAVYHPGFRDWRSRNSPPGCGDM